ncbi:hypothetical protein C2G38_2180551 [Gigaspora rosea]|uniref:HCP-like protein n=1 Tax=Gigaspora rosea TaxID=44941 RepID=A0A397VF18_9GLOM|nr:hypothetical protein C2G38_2180551 [Gigaspora rosea]
MGSPKGMYMVGYYYLHEIGVEYDGHKAFICIQQSANMDNINGTSTLGTCYQYGTGVEKDEHKHSSIITNLLRWEKSYEMESTQGTFNAGTCYRCGKGIKKDVNKAFVYYQESAKLGHVKGIPHIDMCYLDGIGVEKDDYKALTYKNLSMMEILRIKRSHEFIKEFKAYSKIDLKNPTFLKCYGISKDSVSGDCVSFWSLQEMDLYGKI